jgi:hypothetical protein
MYKEEIVKKCLLDNYVDLLEKRECNIDDIEILHQVDFHDQILSISFYNKKSNTVLNMYISKQSLDETISEIRDEKIKKLLDE